MHFVIDSAISRGEFSVTRKNINLKGKLKTSSLHVYICHLLSSDLNINLTHYRSIDICTLTAIFLLRKASSFIIYKTMFLFDMTFFDVENGNVDNFAPTRN